MNGYRSTVRNYGVQIVVLVVTVVVLMIVFPGFANPSAVFAMLNNIAPVGFIAVGVAVTMIAGELDMSVASNAIVAGIIAVEVLAVVPPGVGMVLALLVPMLAGTLFGMLQGWLIYRLRINSLVFTIGTLIFLGGLAFIISGSQPVSVKDYTVPDAFSQRWLFLSPSIVIGILVFAAIGLFLAKFRQGREIYAIGGARQEALAAGVPLRRAMIVTFGISGGCAALAGALVCIPNASATPLAFSDLLVQGISAVLIGGISLYGGRGTIWNVVLGFLIVSALSAGMAAGGAQPYIATLVTGILLFVLITIEFVGNVVGAKTRLRHLRAAADLAHA